MRHIALATVMIVGALLVTSTLAGVIERVVTNKTHYETVGDSATVRR